MDIVYEVILSLKAVEDLSEAIAWYEEQREELGERFTLSFLEVVKLLEQKPKLFAKVYEEVRHTRMNKFPYAVFYVIQENTNVVDIIAVLHEKKNPQVWKKRINT